MRKKIIILISSGALVIVLLICFAAVISKPPPLQVGATLQHPFSYFASQVQAGPNNGLVSTYCGGSGTTFVYGTHFVFPPNGRDCAVTRSFTYRFDTNGVVVSITPGWKCYIFDFLD
jgi:hypothetical protein